MVTFDLAYKSLTYGFQEITKRAKNYDFLRPNHFFTTILNRAGKRLIQKSESGRLKNPRLENFSLNPWTYISPKTLILGLRVEFMSPSPSSDFCWTLKFFTSMTGIRELESDSPG